MNTRILSLSVVTLFGAALLVGCGPVASTPSPMPTPANETGDTVIPASSSTIAAITGVNACTVFSLDDLKALNPRSAPTTTSDGTPKPGFSAAGNTYSNCHWDLVSGLAFELHVETFANTQNAKDLVVSDYADIRANPNPDYVYAMEPTLGSEAYYSLARQSGSLTVVKGNSFYVLMLKTTGNLDSTMAKPALKDLAAKIW